MLQITLAYPFNVENGRVLQAKDNWQDCAAYVFCLCLSFFGYKQKANDLINPWHLFEDLSCIAAEQYIQGEVIKFGTRAKSDFPSFSEAVNELCRRFGEGQGFKKQTSLKKKDDNVDLVVWKNFRDGQPSKLIMFGQCAAGEKWAEEKKISHLDPQAFWDQWMNEGKTTQQLIRSFYFPQRVPKDRWNYFARYAGILFDRCRVAYWAFQNNQTVVNDPRYMQWSNSVLQ